MFSFEETSKNFEKSLIQVTKEIHSGLDEQRIKLKNDLDDAILKAEASMISAAESSSATLGQEINKQIKFAKENIDSTVVLTAEEISKIISESLSSMKKTIIIPSLKFYFISGISISGLAGYIIGRLG